MADAVKRSGRDLFPNSWHPFEAVYFRMCSLHLNGMIIAASYFYVHIVALNGRLIVVFPQLTR